MPRAMDTLSKAVQTATARLQAAGIDQPRRDARLLVARAIGAGIAQTIAESERPLTAAEHAALSAMVAQRAARKPMSQITGTREFWSLPFAVNQDVLTPRPDSETLVAAVLGTVTDRTAPLRLLDLGTGTGCLLLALLSELPAAYGIGVDICQPAVAVARANAGTLALSRSTAFVVGDWSAALSGPFDIIISNPPYIPAGAIDALMPEVARYEPRDALAGGQDGYDAYRAMIPALRALLAPAGMVALEIGAGMAEKTAEIAAHHGLAAVSRHLDLAGIERCLLLAQHESAHNLKKRLGMPGINA